MTLASVPTTHRIRPPGRPASQVEYRVPFFDTDAMGVVHHANYLRYFELARTQFLEEQDAPYETYLALGLHFAVIRCEVEYCLSARFGERLEVSCWLESVGGASVCMGYRIERAGNLIATGSTEHALIDETGKPRRIPRERRKALQALTQP
ncbi:acyl-CoA thioesterase [Myxococcota bacterium]|nr:acyl-CoA thioesterase [Myxococcota bacterium]